MTTLVAFVRSLLADPRSVRAFDEATLDWRTEAADTASAFGRVLINLRGLLSMARVFVMVLPREVAALSAGFAVRLGLLVFVLSPLLTFRPVLVFATQRGMSLGPHVLTLMFLLMVPQALAITLPVGAFWAALWPTRNHSQPWAALATMIAIGSLGLLGWIVPYSNQTFRIVTYAALAHTPISEARRLSPGIPETTLPRLVLSEEPRYRSRGVTLIGESVFAGTLVLLASRLTRNWRRRWILAGVVPVVYLASFSSPVAPWILSAAALWYASRLPA